MAKDAKFERNFPSELQEKLQKTPVQRMSFC